MRKLAFTDILKLVYRKPESVDVYTTIAKDPIFYNLYRGVYRENRFAFNEKMKPYYPDWSTLDFKIDYRISNIYDDKDIRAILKHIDSENLWTKISGNRFEYVDKRVLINTSQPSKPNTSKNTRKRSVQNKNGHLLPKGWHRVSKNGKNSFEGPKAEVYNTMTHYANKNNSRVRPQTYKRTEGNDTWYVLPDGSISWYPYKSQNASDIEAHTD